MGTLSRNGSTGLGDALFSKVQQRVLGLLFGQPDRRFQGAELIRLAQGGSGATHRQLTRLTEAGLVTATRVGNQRYYQANHDSAVFRDLHGLIVKTIGMVGPLNEALQPLAGRIDVAFVFGSVAKGTDRATSDIDLMVIGAGFEYSELYEALHSAEKILGRQVNPTLMTSDEWMARSAVADSFAGRVAAGPKLFVSGNADDLG